MALTTATEPADYEPFCKDVMRLCGIDLSQYKRAQMERRIRSFVAQRGHGAELGPYARLLAGDRGELEAFLDRVTINVSQLWRNPEQWDNLERKIIPELVESGPGRLRCWSAGSSYGAEAYTLAAIALRAAPNARISILGTDIDSRMIEKARTGIFTAEDARDAPKSTLSGHFKEVDGAWHASDELKRLVKFEQGDLLRKPAAENSFDLVLCRNTVIYFNEEVRDALHGRLAASVRSGGIFMVGNTERVTNPAALGLVSEAPFIYRKQ